MDPNQLENALLNLCINARDAMPDGGTLVIASKNCVVDEHYGGMNTQAKPGMYVAISVTDVDLDASRLRLTHDGSARTRSRAPGRCG